MFDNLSYKLEKAFQTLKGQGKITEINVAATTKEIRKALIDADVNYKVAKEVTDEIRNEALGVLQDDGHLLVVLLEQALADPDAGRLCDKGDEEVVLSWKTRSCDLGQDLADNPPQSFLGEDVVADQIFCHSVLGSSENPASP